MFSLKMSWIVPEPTPYPWINFRDSEKLLSKHKRSHGRNSTMWPPEYKQKRCCTTQFGGRLLKMS